jgi:hypothetical protein
MQQNVKLSCDDGSKEVNGTVYREMVGSLNDLTTTRLDISYSVSVLSRFMAKPHESHWRYLKGTLDYGIKYTDASDVELTSYSDSDWAGNPNDRGSLDRHSTLDLGLFHGAVKSSLLYLCLLPKQNIKPCVQQLVKLFG